MTSSSPFPPGSSLACYLRDSGGARQAQSIDQQHTALLNWCSTHNHTLTRIFADRARPGGTTAGRDQFHACLAHFSNPPFPETGLLLWDLSRWAREVKTGLLHFLQLETQGIKIWPIAEPIPDPPFGLYYIVMKFISAEDENKRRSAAVKRGIDTLITTHRAWPTNRPPAGYRLRLDTIGCHRDGQPHTVRRLEPDPATAPLIQRAYQMAAEHASLLEIHTAIPLYNQSSTWSETLTNPIYTGAYNHSGLTVPDYCPPIIDPDLFARVQKIRTSARAREHFAHPRAVHSQHLLTGLAYCAHCGARLFGRIQTTAGRQYPYYRCSNAGPKHPNPCPDPRSIRAEPLETAVLNRLHYILSTPALLDQLQTDQHTALQTRHTTHLALLDHHRQEITNLQRQINHLLDALSKRPASPALLTRLDQLETALTAAQTTLTTLETATPPTPLTPATLTHTLDHLRTRLATATPRDHQQILRTLNTHILAAPGHPTPTITFAIPPLTLTLPLDL